MRVKNFLDWSRFSFSSYFFSPESICSPSPFLYCPKCLLLSVLRGWGEGTERNKGKRLLPVQPKARTPLSLLTKLYFFLPGHEGTAFHPLFKMPQFNITWFYLSNHIPALEAFTAPEVLVLNSALQTSYNCNYFNSGTIVKIQNLIVWTVQPRVGSWWLVNLPFTLFHTISFVLSFYGLEETDVSKVCTVQLFNMGMLLQMPNVVPLHSLKLEHAAE